jgi:hypothetical protein
MPRTALYLRPSGVSSEVTAQVDCIVDVPEQKMGHYYPSPPQRLPKV